MPSEDVGVGEEYREVTHKGNAGRPHAEEMPRGHTVRPGPTPSLAPQGGLINPRREAELTELRAYLFLPFLQPAGLAGTPPIAN